MMKIHLVNPSDTAFGTAVITPRWLYVLAAATPSEFGDPLIWDETLRNLGNMSGLCVMAMTGLSSLTWERVGAAGIELQ